MINLHTNKQFITIFSLNKFPYSLSLPVCYSNIIVRIPFANQFDWLIKEHRVNNVFAYAAFNTRFPCIKRASNFCFAQNKHNVKKIL